MLKLFTLRILCVKRTRAVRVYVFHRYLHYALPAGSTQRTQESCIQARRYSAPRRTESSTSIFNDSLRLIIAISSPYLASSGRVRGLASFLSYMYVVFTYNEIDCSPCIRFNYLWT